MSKILESPESVKLYQTALFELGHYKGEIDGTCGPKTKAADEKFTARVDSDNLRLVLLMRAARRLAESATGLLDVVDGKP